jgi:hypothetical protein
VFGGRGLVGGYQAAEEGEFLGRLPRLAEPDRETGVAAVVVAGVRPRAVTAGAVRAEPVGLNLPRGWQGGREHIDAVAGAPPTVTYWLRATATNQFRPAVHTTARKRRCRNRGCQLTAVRC